MQKPTVLLLMHDPEQRDIVRRRLLEMDVTPIAVIADSAIEAIAEFRPITAVLDEAHAALAPDAFLESTCAHHVRLVTWPDPLAAQTVGDSMLRDATMVRPKGEGTLASSNP
jgi:hypothetical protein